MKASKSGIVLKLTPDYGFHYNKDFIKHNQDAYDKFDKALNEYKDILAEEDPKKIAEFEKMAKTYVDNYIKDYTFNELNTYWKNIKEKNDLDESRGQFKSEECAKMNDISYECKKYNIGLHSTYCCYIAGSLSFINQTVALKTIPDLPLLSTFTQYKSSIPWCVINRILKQHLNNNLSTDSDNVAIHINRKKAQDFA